MLAVLSIFGVTILRGSTATAFVVAIGLLAVASGSTDCFEATTGSLVVVELFVNATVVGFVRASD